MFSRWRILLWVGVLWHAHLRNPYHLSPECKQNLQFSDLCSWRVATRWLFRCFWKSMNEHLRKSNNKNPGGGFKYFDFHPYVGKISNLTHIFHLLHNYRWWFQIFFLNFHPDLSGNDPIWRSQIFQKRMAQPPPDPVEESAPCAPQRVSIIAHYRIHWDDCIYNLHFAAKKSTHSLSHRIHVWAIHLHLPWKSTKCRCIYQSHGSVMGIGYPMDRDRIRGVVRNTFAEGRIFGNLT